MNKVREKILLLLLGGLAFGYSITPGKQRRVLKIISKEWNKIDRRELLKGISYLCRVGFIEENIHNGEVMISPTQKGKLKLLNIKLDDIKNKNKKWDDKWRMVAFDIPEKYKRGRDALRRKLKKIGFCELQKSVLITPYDCKEEIIDLVKLFELEKYVRFGILEFVDNESYLKNAFKID